MRMSDNQRIVIAMLDGMGLDYFNSGDMPNLAAMAGEGLRVDVKGMFPSVTNVNNVSIATGAWPIEHGISANSRFDPETGTAVYLNAGVRVPSIFRRASAAGVKSALLTSKRKTLELFGADAEIAVAAEDLSSQQAATYGSAPPIYSREINYWLYETALKILDARPDIGLLYVHTTDYPMHAWSPEAPESREHLKTIDSSIGRMRSAHPDIAFFATADHGMNAKKRCWDLTRALSARGLPARFVLSPERDYYVKHHRNFTGCAWIWLRDQAEREKTRAIVAGLEGVESVEDSPAVADRYRLDPAALGDLVAHGDRDTMFGDMDAEREDLSEGYRAHGSLHEMDVPLIVWNHRGGRSAPESFEYNKDLTALLFN
jgi:phosphonoacetate hydrolase